jgi:putative ABC transport system permease protein
MANYLYRRMNREIKKIKWRAVGSSVLIIISVVMYMSFSTMVPIASEALEQKVEDQRLNEYIVHVNGANETEANSLSALSGVDMVEYRLQISSRAGYREGGEDKDVACFLYGIEPDQMPNINMMEIEGNGEYFTGNGSGTVLVERYTAQQAGLEVGEKITITTMAGPAELTIIGIVNTPEFIFMPINPYSLMPLPGSLGVFFVPIDWLRGAYGLHDQFVNEFMFMFDDGLGKDEREALQKSINDRLSQNIIIYNVPKEEVYGYALVKEDLSAGESTTDLFAMLFLGIAFFIVYISFVRIVQEQQREIGILRALGYSRGKVLGSYLYMAFLIGGLSSLIGIILGLPMGMLMGQFYVDLMFGLNLYSSIVIIPEFIVVSALFGPVTACSACLIAVWGTVTMEPQEAIRGTPRRFLKRWRGKPKKAAVKLGKPHKGSYITHYTFRNMGRHKIRTALTAVAIGGAMVVGSMSLIMMASFENSLYGAIEDYEKWDVLVEFSYPINGSAASTIDSPHVTEKVLISRAIAEWNIVGGKRGQAVLIGMDKDQDLHKFNLDSGRTSRNLFEAMANKQFAEDNGFGTGDLLHFSTGANCTGPQAGNCTVDLKVVGLVEDIIGSVFVDIEVMDDIVGTVVYSGMYVKTAPGTAKQATKDFRASPLVSEALTRDSIRIGLFDMMGDYTALLYVMSLFGIAIAAPTLANIVFISVLERYPEYGQLRAIGYSKKAIRKSMLLELMAIVTTGVIIGVPLTYGLIWAIEDMFKSFFPMYDTLLYLKDWGDYIVVSLMVYGVALLAALPGIRLVNKMDIADTVAGGRFG